MISDEAVEAAAAAFFEAVDDPPYTIAMRHALDAAAPHILAAVADEREGDLFRFTISQREWLRSNPYRSQS